MASEVGREKLRATLSCRERLATSASLCLASADPLVNWTASPPWRRVRSVPTFVLRLIAPRPRFAETMTDSEREIMGDHAAHWRPYLERGEMVVFGPVLTDTDSYGLAVR